MSGGGNSGPAPGLPASTVPAASGLTGTGMNYPSAPTQITYPAGMPGQLEMIAQQLAAGGYGTQSANLANMQNVNRPTSINALLQNAPQTSGSQSGASAPAGNIWIDPWGGIIDQPWNQGTWRQAEPMTQEQYNASGYRRG